MVQVFAGPPGGLVEQDPIGDSENQMADQQGETT